jgi:hypothetical protein
MSKTASHSEFSTFATKHGDHARDVGLHPDAPSPNCNDEGRDPAMSALRVRRDKAALSSGCKPHPATAPAGAVSQSRLVRFLEHRVGDKRIIRLIQKWLKAGILEDGVVTVDDRGTGQGSVISPLLANIYLHYCFDLWAERWRRREAQGDMIVVRYADDLAVGFEHEGDAHRFLNAMRERLGNLRCRFTRTRPA